MKPRHPLLAALAASAGLALRAGSQVQRSEQRQVARQHIEGDRNNYHCKDDVERAAPVGRRLRGAVPGNPPARPPPTNSPASCHEISPDHA